MSSSICGRWFFSGGMLVGLAARFLRWRVVEFEVLGILPATSVVYSSSLKSLVYWICGETF